MQKVKAVLGAAALVLGLNFQAANAQEAKELCIFDPAGANGYIYQMYKEYRRDILSTGVQVNLVPYRNEDRLIEDFEKKLCDMAAVTDMGARKYNNFTGAISAVGAIPRYEDLRVLLYILGGSRAAKYMETDTHQVIGVLPMGAAYLFGNDHSMTDIEDLKGKRFTVLADHYDAEYMVKYVGGVPVPSRISNFAEIFNSGGADVIYAPITAYEFLELYKGMGNNGGVADYPVGQVTSQLIVRKGEFDDKFVKRSRKVVSRMYPEAMRLIRYYEKAIPDEAWIKISDEDIRGYQEMFRQVRIKLQGLDADENPAAKVFNEQMMTTLRKVRCYTNPGNPECSSSDRE